MGKILVTGATGQLGGKTVEQLLKRVPASDVIGLARDPAKLADLAAKGVEIRAGDYFDYDGLLRAFEGVEKVMLISATAFTDRMKQHYNVITAAREAGVRHIVYTAIMRKDGGRNIPHVTESDIFTEQTLAASNVPHTVAVQPAFLDGLLTHIGNPLEVGFRMPPGNGPILAVLRDDLAEAQAVILTEPGHENQRYLLGGDVTTTFADMARSLSEAHGRHVPLVEISEREFVQDRIKEGFPEGFAKFALEWILALQDGDFSATSNDFERLVGRKPTSIAEFMKQRYPAAQ